MFELFWNRLDKGFMRDGEKESRINSGWVLKKIALRKGNFYHKIFS
jgi:hypothetical protein